MRAISSSAIAGLLLGFLTVPLSCSRQETVTPTTTTTAGTTSTSVMSGTAVNAATSIVKIPNRNFEQALIDLGIDSDKTLNGQVSRTDALGVTSINIAFKSIADLTGIEGFTNLTALMCGYNKLTVLNVSSNTALKKLVCHYNSLTGKLDVKALKLLTSLDAVGNAGLTTICVPDVETAKANANFLKDATAAYSVCP